MTWIDTGSLVIAPTRWESPNILDPLRRRIRRMRDKAERLWRKTYDPSRFTWPTQPGYKHGRWTPIHECGVFDVRYGRLRHRLIVSVDTDRCPQWNWVSRGTRPHVIERYPWLRIHPGQTNLYAPRGLRLRRVNHPGVSKPRSLERWWTDASRDLRP